MSIRLTEPSFATPPPFIGHAGHAVVPARGTPAFWIMLGLAALAVAVLPPTLGLTAVLGFAGFMILLSRPFVALCALAFTVPFDTLHDVQAGGLTITITNFVVLCVGMAWLTRGVTVGTLQVGPTPWRPALLLYGAALLLSMTQAHDFVLSIKELLKWGQLTFVYLAGVTLVRTRRDLRLLVAVIFAAVLVEGAVDMAQTFIHAGPSSFARGGLIRAGGTFDQPNPLAGYLNMVLPLAVGCLIFRVFDRRLMWLVTIGAGGGVLVTLSRGGELGAAAALIVMAAVISKQARGLVLAGVAAFALLLAGVAAGVVPASVTDPIATTVGVGNVDVINPTPLTWSSAERLAHMEAGLAMWADHPILGVGIGNYPAVYDKYKVAGVWGNPLGHAHNYYINIGAEAGAVGFLAYLLLFAGAIVIAARSYRRAPDDIGRAMALGGLGVIVAFSVHQFVDNLFVHGLEVQIALVMVLATCAGYRRAPEAGIARVEAPERGPDEIGVWETGRRYRGWLGRR